jgi:uncharacterized protein (DUF2236 family)
VIDLREPVRSTINSLFGADRFPEERYDEPLGDPGLFGPGSATWQVHADVSMFVGGIAALLLQALHPRAAAVVASSSTFRNQPLHRLSRTASFVAATTFAATPVAEAVMARVRSVHDRVPGAGEPDLLRWVHVAEVASFLGAYRRYRRVPVDGDRYYAETAVIAERLGATDVPRSEAEVTRYFAEIQDELATSAESRELLGFLRAPLGDDPVTRSVYRLFFQAAGAQLPAWAQERHGIGLAAGVDRLVVRPATSAALQALRLALGRSPILEAATKRAGGPATGSRGVPPSPGVPSH